MLATVMKPWLMFIGLALSACTPAAGGLGSDSNPTPSSASDTGTGSDTGPPPVTDTTVATETGDSVSTLDGTSTGPGTETNSTTSSTTDAETDTDPGCPPGTEDCPCDAGVCDEGLVCMDEECVASLCGDGTVDEGEVCDDGNAVEFDGCEADCTLSPGARSIAAGSEHVCVVFHSGDVKCWGNGGSGRLGYAATDDVGNDETPAMMGFVDIGGPVVQLALGDAHTCARLESGEVRCWGEGDNGRLGYGTTTDIGDGEDPSLAGSIDIGGAADDLAVGTQHTCVVVGGAVRCWGRNNQGQLGIGSTEDIGDNGPIILESPVDLGDDIAVDVEAGREHTCVVLASGEVRCWGRNNQGQLGRGDTNDIFDPSGQPEVTLPETVDALVCGEQHCCAQLSGSGHMLCWGEGMVGRLGYGNNDDIGNDERLDAPTVVPVDFTALLGSPLAELSTYDAHTCARLDGGELTCWGEAAEGQLGRGNTMDQNSPPSPLTTGVAAEPRQLAAGGNFTCVLYVNGDVKCWGRNNRGQLGYGNTTDIGDDEAIDTVGTVPLE